ncbi:hypothetical protein EV659_106146 [Rhodothalassium salexigens DSM 2132]|uniref:DUF3108 domain-containing protein n=1 Tax=Rhodothalassium salexigens DSM 2132 TaxID=1188247 RepID=A0A4R2PHH3_RHOSA|nr:DUF6134 family protein [Rhodothalassium salexigens]MBB4211714.1 hypothetical protein [Rhodothalassium salexigens DSM 2132]MBK1639175.1 hypothetical protein [Rhodothalassium salexigens DSM 2132]TCP33988.1 hypothetical protein EV659_106146 [Rhodothalassium salexigens DSM 2132]
MIRHCLKVSAALIAAAIVVTATPATATNTAPVRHAFDVRAKGANIGQHVFSIDTLEDGTKYVDIEAKLKLKFVFVTVFKLHHQAQEIWRDGRLLSMKCVTEKNGERQEMQAVAKDEYILVQTPDDEMHLSQDTVPTSFTREDLWQTTDARDLVLLDTLNGERKPARLRFEGRQQVELNGTVRDLRYFTLTETETGRLSYQFWIDDSGMAARILMHAKDGTDVHYTYAA